MRRLLITVSVVVAASAVPAVAETYGPTVGANSFKASIDTVGAVEDADDYVADLLTGETLTVKVTSPKSSSLFAQLGLVAPDGTVTNLAPTAFSEKSHWLLLKDYPIPATGRWAVRVSGRAGTQGAYTIAFKIGSAKDRGLTKQHLGGVDPLTRELHVDGLDGALLDVTVKWPRNQAPVRIGDVLDPAGAANTTGKPATEKPGSATLRRRVLHQGPGVYSVPLSIVSGETTYEATTHVTPQARPRSRKTVTLSATEPFLEIRSTPVRGDAGLVAHFIGSGFPVSPPPQVLFGGVAGSGVVVASDGRSLDVVVPPGAAGSTVEVAVVQSDGQASVRPNDFVYVPIPTISELTDDASDPVAGGSADGGAALTLVGAGFLPGHVVRFGGQAATGVAVVDSSHIALVTPPGPAGMAAVTLEDEFARIVSAPSAYEYKVPPAFAAAPYSQAYSPTVGGASITITGTGFEPSDRLEFGGASLASTFVDSTTRRFTAPAKAAGPYTVALVDRLRLRATGPNFTVKDAPVFAAAPYLPPFGPTAGGVTITVSGSGFESTDVLQFNGSSVVSAWVDASTMRFVSPAIAPGSYAVTLTDRFGQTGTGPNFTVKDAPAFAASPYSPAFATTAGGTTITITGSGFESTDQLGFNGQPTASTFVSSTTRRFTTTALATGSYTVALIDRFGQIGTGPNFTVKDPPTLAATPYSPTFANSAGGTTVTITGTGFESADQLKFNGSNLASTYVSSTTRRFTSPAIAAGSYSVAIVDRFGAVVNGPNFTVKDPPAFAAAPYSPAFANTPGGTTITITGTGFESQDQLRFNGSNITSTFVDSATRRFTSPAVPAGSYSVALVDRFSQTALGPGFTVKDPPVFAAAPYSQTFGSTLGGETVTITGSKFESTDQLVFNGSSLASTFVSSTTRTFVTPADPAGFCSVALVDRFGQTATGPAFELRVYLPVITGVEAIAGPHIGATKIAANGGATIQVTGSGFFTGDTVTLGGASAEIASLSYSQFTFTAPAGSFGSATLIVSDSAGNSSTSTALTYVGFGDATAARLPGSSSKDNYMATRGVIGDLDGDGTADDFVITMNDAGTSFYYYPLGTRAVETRLLVGGGSTTTDTTDADFPAPTSYFDKYKAVAVAIGDLDGDGSQDIAITGGFSAVWNGGTPVANLDGRVFLNDGSGAFTQASYAWQVNWSPVTCTDAYGATYKVAALGSPRFSEPTGIAIGDLDGDGHADIVLATISYRADFTYIDPRYVTFTPGSYYDANAASDYQSTPTYVCTSATRVFANQGANGFVDVTFPRLPLCGRRGFESTIPGFSARDVKLGDLDGDGSLDIVLTWDDPITTTPYGQFCIRNLPPQFRDIPRDCTKVLINDGSGFFTDATSAWIPPVADPEFWQGNRLELADLDEDGKTDLILLHAKPLDGMTTTTSSLRILHNIGQNGGFVDVTSSALPSVPLSGTLDDNLRGSALAVRDVDGDGHLDIVVGTLEPLVDSSGNAVRRTRLLLGDGALHFTPANAFLPLPSVDTGEAADVLIGDLAGGGAMSLVLITRYFPTTSTNGERMRVFEWK